MGKAKHRFSSARASTKKATPVVSKRSASKNTRRKIASGQRKSVLLKHLASEREAQQEAERALANPFQGESLEAALDAIAAQPAQKKKKIVPKGKSNKSKQYILTQETARMQAVLHHPTFQNDPIQAICAHLAATLPSR